MTLEELKHQTLTLSTDDRLALAQHLFIAAGCESTLFANAEIEQAWIAEAHRRDRELDDGVVEPEDAFAVIHRLRERLAG